MPPFGASQIEDDTMYQSLKGRVRRPSAKVLEKDEVLVNTPTAPPSAVLVVPVTPPVLSLQVAVAEVLIDEEDEDVSGRDTPTTVEAVPAGVWKVHGRGWESRTKASLKRKNQTPTRSMSSPQQSVAKKEEEKPIEEEEVKTVEELEEQQQPTAMAAAAAEESENEDKLSSSPNGVKRKRGRPFKGQEKPVEERLMIETTKIRRLIDDILRKSAKDTTAEFCLKLRNIARDIDEAMRSFPSPTFGPSDLPAEEVIAPEEEPLAAAEDPIEPPLPSTEL